MPGEMAGPALTHRLHLKEMHARSRSDEKGYKK